MGTKEQQLNQLLKGLTPYQRSMVEFKSRTGIDGALAMANEYSGTSSMATSARKFSTFVNGGSVGPTSVNQAAINNFDTRLASSSISAMAPYEQVLSSLPNREAEIANMSDQELKQAIANNPGASALQKAYDVTPNHPTVTPETGSTWYDRNIGGLTPEQYASENGFTNSNLAYGDLSFEQKTDMMKGADGTGIRGMDIINGGSKLAGLGLGIYDYFDTGRSQARENLKGARIANKDAQFRLNTNIAAVDAANSAFSNTSRYTTNTQKPKQKPVITKKTPNKTSRFA